MSPNVELGVSPLNRVRLKTSMVISASTTPSADAEKGTLKQRSSLISHIVLLSWRRFSYCPRAPGAQLRTLVEGLHVGMNRASGNLRHLPLR
jgi:hypothetical protein